MTIKQTDTGFELSNLKTITGKVILGKAQLSDEEFWELCRYGNRIDTRREVKEWVEEYGDDEFKERWGIEVDELLEDEELLDSVVESVIQCRVGNESPDEIIEALEVLLF